MTVKNHGSSSNQIKYATIRELTSNNSITSHYMKSLNVEKGYQETNKLLNKIKEVYNQRNPVLNETDYTNNRNSNTNVSSSLPSASNLIKNMENHLKQPIIKLPQSQSYLYNQNQNHSAVSLANKHNHHHHHKNNKDYSSITNNINNNDYTSKSSNQQTIQLISKIKEINKSGSQTDVIKLNRLLYGSTRTTRTLGPVYHSLSSRYKSDHALNVNQINFDDKNFINNLSINNLSHTSAGTNNNTSNSTINTTKLSTLSTNSKPLMYKMNNGRLEELYTSNSNSQIASFQPSLRVKSSSKRPILLESDLVKSSSSNQIKRSMSMYDKENNKMYTSSNIYKANTNKNSSSNNNDNSNNNYTTTHRVKFDFDKNKFSNQTLKSSKSNGSIGNLKLNDSAIKLNPQGEGTITFNFDLPPNVNPNNINVMLDKKKENIIIESTDKKDSYVISLPKNAAFEELEYSLDKIKTDRNSKDPSLNLEVAMNLELPEDIDPSYDVDVILNDDQILIQRKDTNDILYRIALPENTDFDRMEYNMQKLSESNSNNQVKSNDSIKFKTNSKCLNPIYDNNVSYFCL